MARAGVPLAVVQEIFGHSNPAVQRHYLHIGREATQAAIETLPDVLAALPEAVEDDDDETVLRARLRALADTLPLADIRALLAFARNSRGNLEN